LFFVFFNSFYSFYWDVAKDWDLTLFSSLLSSTFPSVFPPSVTTTTFHSNQIPPNQAHPWALRPHTHFPTPQIYYTAIGLDLLLRCTWSLKLSPHLDHWNDLEGTIFLLEMAEVVRRWVWIFFRVETEWVRVRSGAAGVDEMLLAPMGR
ncbi:MAG: hypothetical protein L6R42_010251, partial [Xanthoria sp. 1 TBL-2021]